MSPAYDRLQHDTVLAPMRRDYLINMDIPPIRRIETGKSVHARLHWNNRFWPLVTSGAVCPQWVRSSPLV